MNDQPGKLINLNHSDCLKFGCPRCGYKHWTENQENIGNCLCKNCRKEFHTAISGENITVQKHPRRGTLAWSDVKSHKRNKHS